MLEVVVILHPAEGGPQEEIGRMLVVNDASHPEHPVVGNYDVAAHTRAQRGRKASVSTGRVEAWGRDGALWPFLARCAEAVR